MGKIKKNKFSFHIRLKIILVILISIIFSLITYYFFSINLKNFLQSSEKIQQNEYKILVKSVLESQSDYIKKISLDYGCYDWMTRFVTIKDTAQSNEYISPPDYLGIDMFSVYDLKRNEILCNRSVFHKNLTYSLNKKFFQQLYQKKFMNFFDYVDNNIIQIIAVTIQKTQDTERIGRPFGYLVLLKIYDQDYKTKTEKSTNCKLKITPLKNKNNHIGNYDILLRDYCDKQVVGINIIKDNVIISNVKKLNHKLEWIYILYIIGFIAITIVAYNSIVIRPINIIQSALNNQSDKIARKLMYKRDEFGKIARLIIRFFEQRKLLDEKLTKLNNTKNELKCLNNELVNTADELRTANEAILNQQKNITDNIYYASIVQRAALIPYIEIEKIFQEHLILFKPRDIISGDFYWFQTYKNRYFVATADCTGHGLSGSLMSMLGISFLNQIVQQSDENINSAGILKKLRRMVVDSLHQQGANIEISDSIDIGLCIFNFDDFTLNYAAAYNPLLLIRRNEKTQEYDITVYKGDSMSAGIYEVENNYSNYTISLQPGDIIYMYTDGFVDQFGGPENKKYMTKRLKELLLSIAHLPLNKQQEFINYEFEKWKGDNYQVDDVTLVGLKIGEKK